MKAAEISICSLAKFLPNMKKNIFILHTDWFASTITEEKIVMGFWKELSLPGPDVGNTSSDAGSQNF